MDDLALLPDGENVIYTTIPFGDGLEQTFSVDTLFPERDSIESIESSPSSSSSSLHEQEQQQQQGTGKQHSMEKDPSLKKLLLSSDDNNDDASTLLRPSNKYPSLAIGAVIGLFIQLSSMGAYFLYISIVSKQQEKNSQDGARTPDKVFFSMIWSACTSLMGLVLVYLLSMLIRKTQRDGIVEESFLLHMECYVATGIVFGMSLACIIKNFLMEGYICWYQACFLLLTTMLYHMWQSVLVMGLHFMSRLCLTIERKDETNEEEIHVQHKPVDDVEFHADDATVSSDLSSLSRPLLPQHENVSPKGNKTSHRIVSTMIGFIVGSFIQLSCLGANVVLLYLWSHNGNGNNKGSLKEAITFHMGWDYLTCALGVLVLFCVRRLIQLQWLQHQRDIILSQEHQSRLNLLLQVESYFSFGALVGTNFSWVITNYTMGFHSNASQSLVMLGLSLLWCSAVVVSASRERQM